MQVNLFTIMAGPDGVKMPGVVEVTPEQAKQLVDGKFAEYLPGQEPKEEKPKPSKKRKV